MTELNDLNDYYLCFINMLVLNILIIPFNHNVYIFV